MTILQGAGLGIIQGLTEFLPISSTGHLELARHIFGAGPAEDVGMEVALHAGTLIAVIVFYWKKLVEFGVGVLKRDSVSLRWMLYLILGTIPAGVIGIAFKDYFAESFNDLPLLGTGFIATGVLLLLAEWWKSGSLSVEKMGIWRPILIGVAQAVAIIPSISRSGSTIAGALMSGVERKQAVDFSFLLSIPVIGGAVLLTLKDWATGSIVIGLPHLVGAIISMVIGYASIAVMLKVVANRHLKWFALYCILIGIFTWVHLVV